MQWTTLIGDFPFTTSNSYTINGGLVAGRIYKFRYAARSIFGIGPWSDQGDVLASDVPSKSPSVITSQVGTSVQIAWSSDIKDNGSQISAYKILIKTSDSLFVEDTLCDGENPVIFINTYCLLPMTRFLSSPYNLNQGDTIVATVSSRNTVGWSEISTPNTIGQQVKQPPPIAPPSLNIDYSKTNEN